MRSDEIGKGNEALVVKHYQDKGFTVLNQNDAGFPDLLLFRGKELVKMVEVKGGRHKVHEHQQDYLRKLESSGYKIKVAQVDDGKITKIISLGEYFKEILKRRRTKKNDTRRA